MRKFNNVPNVDDPKVDLTFTDFERNGDEIDNNFTYLLRRFRK